MKYLSFLAVVFLIGCGEDRTLGTSFQSKADEALLGEWCDYFECVKFSNDSITFSDKTIGADLYSDAYKVEKDLIISDIFQPSTDCKYKISNDSLYLKSLRINKSYRRTK